MLRYNLYTMLKLALDICIQDFNLFSHYFISCQLYINILERTLASIYNWSVSHCDGYRP